MSSPRFCGGILAHAAGIIGLGSEACWGPRLRYLCGFQEVIVKDRDRNETGTLWGVFVGSIAPFRNLAHVSR